MTEEANISDIAEIIEQGIEDIELERPEPPKVLVLDGPCDPPEPAILTFPYQTDHFQNHAFRAIDAGYHVLVTAHTGSGKTTIAEYAVAAALAQGRKVYYTSPIKALSNQIFGDFRRKHPDWSVGLRTGDLDIASDSASVVIMTTEILRDMVANGQTLDDVVMVVFDEVHYIKDKKRGTVWEESICNVPNHVQIVALSATLPDALEFAGWIARCRGRNTAYVTTTRRIIPLTHVMLTDDGHKRHVIMDNEGHFFTQTYERVRQLYDFKPSQLGTYLECINLPALLFCFSKRQCEERAKSLVSMLTREECVMNEREYEHLLRGFRDREAIEASPQTAEIRQLVLRGVCYHHSGLLPALKEIVQELFARGRLKVLLVTETFAAGVNLPAKSVVFTGFSKYDDEANQFRTLYTEEYLQMAGRAGRRGIDTVGEVILLPFNERDLLECEDARRMMCGKLRPITSNLRLDYAFVFRSLLSGTAPRLTSSLCAEQLERQNVGVHKEIVALRDEIAALQIIEETDLMKDFMRYKLGLNRPNAQAKFGKRLSQMNPAERKALETAVAEREHSSTLRQRLKTLEGTVQDVDMYFQEQLEQICAFLYKGEYLSTPAPAGREDVTVLGVMCSEFNEANGLLLTETLRRGYLNDLDTNQCIVLLSSFLEEAETDREKCYSQAVRSRLPHLREMADTLERQELNETPVRSSWLVSDELCDVVESWLTKGDMGQIYVDTNTTLYGGEIVRYLLKLNNLCKETLAAALVGGYGKVAELLANHSDRLIKGVARPDSLYVR